MAKGWDFRDVSLLFKKLREILLGRPHNLHARFPPTMSSRTIPPPDIPRGPDATNTYSNQYYYQRSAMDSVNPPVVAPVAAGPSLDLDPKKKSAFGGGKADALCFSSVPTPGAPWWWDGHCYFECVADPPPPAPVCPPPCPPPKEDKCKQATEEKK